VRAWTPTPASFAAFNNLEIFRIYYPNLPNP
jgi:hypothetical protein